MLFLLAGNTIDPSVSVPSAAAASPMALAMALPELEPEGPAFSKNGHVACPPRPEKPDGTSPRKCDHSDRLAFPSRSAPALRSFAATVASRGGTEPSRENDPTQVVNILSSPRGCANPQWYSCLSNKTGLMQAKRIQIDSLPSLMSVAMLSLSRIGIPCKGPREPFSFRSTSSAAA